LVVKVVGLSLPEELIAAIDEYRGDVTRSKYILRLIEEGLRQREKLKKK